ncbi:hypothetical protein ACROYT_G044158 [Oculina patagonica]
MRSLIFVLLATGAFAAPVSQDRQRPPECDKKLDRFHHAKDFTYNYEGETVSSVAGASSARSGLRIRARCVVKSVAPCQHVLKIDQVELWEAQSKNPGPLEFQLSQGSTAFAEELEAQDLVFRTNVGRITDILAHPEEPSHVLNIKRGILSALQVQFVDDHATLEEDDVVGKCKVRYEIKSRHLSRRPKVVYKTRNLTECSDRAQTDIGIHVHSYEEKPLSLLNSHSTCRLVLTAKKRTQQVICQEEHVFRPFSAGYQNKSGAITKTRQKLELQSIQSSESEPAVFEEFQLVSLKYAHAQPKSNQKAINDAFYLVTRLSKESQYSTRPDSAQHFSGLVFNIRKLNTPAMQSLWQKVHNEEDHKMHEYFYDALPHCGTGGCAKVMSHAIKNNLVSHERGNMFLSGLAMAANPSKETVAHVLELCEENPGRTAMLTLGTLIHKVCESSPEECNDKDEENPITRAENFLLSRLNGKCKGKTPEDFENILITLKAIGNAGRPVTAENVLLKCALNQEAPVNMSIAALEAFRRLPCNKEMTDQILNIYAEHNLDVEIRIAAYLALMKCPSPEVFKRVAEILKNEVNNQVGSFVWSHMTNAMDSTEPVHGLPQAEMMKDALNGMKLREFNLNRLKFSRAWEGSFYSDILRFGGSAQSHLIYHPNSFFPRSAMVNVTVDVLGASINVLEAAARFEGFEVLIEQMFGDDGYYPDDRIMEMFNLKPHEERDKEEKSVKNLPQRRRRRSASIHEDINKVEKHLNKLHRYMDTRKHHPAGAVSVKMFGNEMRLASFDDISWLNDEVDKVNMIDILIALAKGGKKSYSKSMMFLDAETTVPTILGLPLKLSAKGTTVASVELAGKFDIRNMFWGKMSFDVRGYVKPSAVVDVTGRMGVSAVYAEAGILVNSSLYTVTQIKGNATYTQGEILKFEVGVPEEPVQFINVSSSLFATLNDEKLAIEGTPRRIEPSPCLNMTRLLGITFCSQLSVPLGYRDYQSPFFPFSGPASFSVSMQRTDPKLTKYQLLAERLQTEDENKYDVIAKMSTPGATWERNLDANGTLWIKKDGKLFRVSTGAVGVNFGTFEATYNNITHALNLTYSAKDAVYGHPIVLNGHFFNNTEPNSHSQELGIQLSASYKNYTIKQLTKIYNRSSVYGYVSNLTYWNGKYLFSSGELNIPKKSISLLANHTCTKTELSFNGNLGEEENNFVFSFSNEPTKAGIELTGRHLKTQNEGVLRLFARPCQQSFTLRGSYAKAGEEKGIRFTASHDNKNRVIRWYTGIVNSTNEKSLKANATVLGRKAEAIWTYFNFTQNKGIKFHGLLVNKSIDAVWSYVNMGQEKGLRFNATGLNKTIDAAWTFLNLTTGKSLKFNASAINKTIEAVWSYVNVGKEKGLRFNAVALNQTIQSTLTFRNFTDAKGIKLNATVLNKTLEAVWSYVNAGKEKGLRFNVTALNKTAEIMWSYFNFESKKGLRFNASALNKTIDATWAFINLDTEKSLVFKAIALNKTVESTWTILNLKNEKSLKFQASALNKTINATWTVLNLPNEKSLKFNASVGNKTMNATWTFLSLENVKSLKFQAAGSCNRTIDATWTVHNLPSEKSLKFNASVGNKTMNATWTFLNLENEKTLKFQAAGSCNRTIDATWSFLNLENEKSLKFKASAANKTINATWSFLSSENEKSLKFQAAGSCNRTIDATWTILNLANEKRLIFNASAVNKTINATWTLLKLDNQKSLKFEASAANKTIEAAWTLLNLRNEKGLKFQARVLNKTTEATWTFFNLTTEKGLKFKASALNKSIETTLSFLNFASEKSIKFNASALNKTIETAWTFVNLTNEKLIKFNATGFNRSAEAIWSYLKKENERSIKFNASAMNKTAEVVWSYLKSGNERAIKFHACTSNKSVEAVWSLLKNENERSIKFNASAMNKTIEAVWSYVRSENERAIKFHGSAVNKTVEAVWSYLKSENERSIKFNASAMNKTVDASWTYLKNENEKAIKFHACAANKTVEAVWSYSKGENEKSIKFNASALNKTVEAVWTLFNLDAKKGLKFNLAVMNKTMNASLVYFRNQASMGLHLNVSCCNKSIDLLSKIVFQEKESKVIMRAAYQNYTVALVGLFQNTTSQKTACIYPEYLGRSHGKVCAIFTNSSAEKSMALNLTVLNRTGELKTERFVTPSSCASRVTAKFNNTIFFESWMSFLHTNELKSLHFNTTVVNKSAGATLYFRNDTEKAIGFNATVLKKQVGVEGVWLNGKTLKEAAVLLFWNKTVVAKSSLALLKNTQRKMLEYRAHIGRFVAEWQNTLVTHKTGVKELAMLRMLRNGSQSLFFDSSKLTYSKTDKSRDLGYQYIARVMGRTFEYGWDASYNNYSNAEDSYHEARVSVIYTKGKKVSLTGIYRNTSEELSNTLVVEYLPEKTVSQSLVWYKQRKSVDVRVEVIPRKPITWTTSWNTDEGLSVSSAVSFLNKKIENRFSYSKITGEYEGHFEICPFYPLTVSGILRKENGLFFTTEITAFKRTWNHKIDYKKEERKLQISVDVMPNAPVVFDASWDNTEGMEIAMDLKGFKKSLKLVCEYDTLTKTFTSGLTVFKQTLTFTKKLDTETKTLFLTFAAFNRTAGFTGRFDWKNYVASSFVSYQNNRAGWFLRFNPASRSIVFNVTVTPKISGQVVGEMPDDYRLQVTIQRKFGENVVNETRLRYILNAEASRVSLTWNTSTVTTLINRVKLLKNFIRNVTLRYYNLTILKGKNLTKEVEVLVKKLEAKIKPIALKLYAQVKNYNYTGLLQNATNMAQNMTQRLLNVTVQVLNDTINKLPKMMRNVTELYKTIRLNATEAYKRFRKEVLPPIIGNVTLHLKNISRDIKVWANNVAIMVSTVTVRGEKLGDIAKRVSQKVEVITADLVEKVKVKTQELIIKVREVEVRGQKVGPLYDKYLLEVKEFTCNFNASCTLKNVTIIAKNWTLSVRNITVLNKTLEEHFKLLNKTFQENFELINKTAWQNINLLKKKACLMHQTALNFTKNLTRVLPKLMRNATVRAIYLARNVTKEVRTVIMRVRKVTLVTYRKLMKTHRPLIKLATNVFISVKGKAYPLVLKVVRPIGKFAADLKSNVTRYLKPIVKPLVPMALDIMYQVRNITIRRVPVGHALDKAVILSLEIASETLKSVNHTLSNNISAIIAFIRENSQKTPDEIVDLAIKKSFEFFNLSKKAFNQSIELGFNLSRQVPLVYNRSVIALNKTLQKLLKMRPKEILDITIKKIQFIAKNVSAEVLNVTKQLRALDLGRRVQEAWKEMDLKGKLDALKLKAKWEQLVERIRTFNLKERALLVRYRIGNFTLKVLKEIQDITNLTQRILNLTSDLVNMKISKEAFVTEFIAIGNETSRVFIKYGILAKNTSLDLQMKLRNASYEMAALYKNITVNKTIEAYNKSIEGYNFLKKLALAFYNEHEEEGLVVYNFYKDLLKKIYEDMKEKALKKVNIYREKLTNKVNKLIAKVRQYENMTYEEIVIKAYEFSSKHGLALYKNVSRRALILYKNVTMQVKKLYKNVTLQAMKLYKNVTLHAMKLYKNVTVRALNLYKNVTLKAVRLFNDTKNATLRAYNLTLVLVNRTKLMAIQYYNSTRNLTLHYFNLTRKYSLQYYNLTRNLTLKYYHKFYNLSRNYTLHVYNVTRNITLDAYNKTRTLVLRGIRYINVTIVPLVKENYLKGKVLVLRYSNKTVLFVKKNAEALKVWYHENKEKTVEELYFEAFELAERKYVEIRAIVENKYNENRELVEKKIREAINDAKAKFEVKVEEWKKELQKLNKTAMNITGEAISLYNQTANITSVAAKELAAIFHPYVKSMHNKTIFYLARAKNISLPLLEKARNITLLKLNETAKFLNQSYVKFMARKDVQEFIQKHQLKERYAKAERFVREKYEEIVEYVKEMKPKVEAKVKEAIFYLNVTLPAQIKQRYTLIKERYDVIEKKIQRIMANPKVFIKRLSKKALKKIEIAIKDTPIEKIVYHETLLELIEEVRQYELIEAGQGVANYTSGKLRPAFELASKRLRLIVEKLRNKTELMAEKIKAKVQETRETLLEKFEEVKAMKLREIVEHEYVFKTIDLAKNVTLKIRNITLEAKNLTRKYVAIGKIYYKNMTAKVENFTRILKAKVQNYTNILKAKVQNYTNLLKATIQNYTNLVNATVQNYTKILNATFQNYTKIIKVTVKNYTLILKGHYERIYKSHIVPLHRNYTVLVKKYRAMAERCISRCKNVTLRSIAIARNWTIEKVNLTRVWINKTLERGIKYCRDELERGMKYYREELKPLYYSKVLPFYNNTLVPMYHNYSKLLIALKTNVTKQVLVLKERALDLKLRAINMTKEAVQMTLNSKPYLMLRKFGKLTIRESILEGRILCIRAYNFTLNMTRLAVNMTLEKFNITKLHLTRALNTTLLALNTTLVKSKPVISFLNATRVEAIKTAVFISKYYGIEEAVKERVRRSLDITRNVTMTVVNNHGPQFLRVSALKTLEFINTTIRYVNRTVGYLNVTFIKVTDKLNKTIHHVRLVINKKILDARIAFNKTVQNVRTAVNKTIQDVRVAVNKTYQDVRVAVNKTIQDVRAAVNRTITKARISIRNARIAINKTITDFRLALPKYIQVTDKGITVVIPHPKPFNGNIKSLALASVERVKNLKRDALEKMESLKQEAVIKIKSLKREAVIKFKTMKREALEKMANLKLKALEKMEQLKLKALEKMEQLKLKALEKMEKLKLEALEMMKTLKQQAVVKMETLKQNAIEKYDEFKVKAKNMSIRVKTIGKALVAVAMNKTVLYRQKTYGFVMKVYNMSKNHHLTGKYINITLHYFNITKDLAVFYRHQTYGFLVNAYNLTKNHPLTRKYANTTLHYLNITKNLAIAYRQKTSRFLSNFYNQTKNCPFIVRYTNMTVHYFNVTKKFVNITKNFVKGLNMTQVKNYLFNQTKRCPFIVRYTNLTVHYFNITKNFVKGLNMSLVKNVTDKYLSRALNLSRHCYNVTNKYLSRALNLSRHWYGVCLNKTLNISVQVYKVAENVTLDIYNSSCLGEAMGKAKNYSKIAINVTVKLYRKGLSQCRNFSTVALNKTLKLYREAVLKTKNYTAIAVNRTMKIYREALLKTKNFTTIALNRTLRLYRRVYNKTMLAVYNTTMMKKYFPMALNLSRQLCTVGFNATRNFTVQAYKVVKNVTLDIYNSSCLLEAFGKTKNYSKIAFNVTVKLCRRLYNKTMLVVYNTTMVKKYLPIARQWCSIGFNVTRNFTVQAFKVVENVTLDIYNSSCLREALGKTRNYSKIAFNETLKLYGKALNLTRNYTKIALNKTVKLYRVALLQARNYSMIALNKTIKLYQCLHNKTLRIVYNTTIVKKYLPMALTVSRQTIRMVYNTTLVKKYLPMAFNITRNYTVQVYKVVVNVTLDICNSTSLPQAWGKARNYSRIAFNQTMKICLKVYRKVYNVTSQRYTELRNYSLALYKTIRQHETTVKYLNHARTYLDHSKKIMKSRVRNLHGAKRYFEKRVNHHVSRISHLLNPLNWIPPFNSTAMIFGGPHVYTFDGTYYTFPGYKKPGCMYVLARDVRDDKFTILSQENAIIVVTEDSSVKIHQDGKVETIVKVSSSGKKLTDGYHSELPVETFNTTIQREGSFVVLRHDLGLEILCDVEHFLCTFNIAKWYHGRMAGLLGTNNNEFHDEMIKSDYKPTKRLTEFVNSWEVTRDPECKVFPAENKKPKCKATSYIQRCRALFKDKNSPLSRFYSVVNPEPFVKACELDYKECDTSTPKDMKHCNTTAAYIELVRLQGVWAEYLPECGRCGSNPIGQRWFQKADKAVDVVILVHETSILKSYAEKLPTFLTSLTQSLDPKFSFRFGVMGYGGRLIHERPHAITLNGELMNDLESVELAFEHLKFAGEASENNTGDAMEAMAMAAYTYPFRPGATKIFLLLTSTDRNPLADFTSVESISNMLETKDIILNVIGKYRKFRGEVMGQNFRGNVFYRKKPEIGSGAAPLPEGEYVSLMKATKGSVFGLPFLGSENKDKFGALQQASASAARPSARKTHFITSAEESRNDSS